MSWKLLSGWLAGFALVGLGCPGEPEAAPAGAGVEAAVDGGEASPDPEPDRRMAITVDDLPLVSASQYRDDAHRMEAVEAFCALVEARELPVTGFVNMQRHGAQPELLERWKGAGIRLGNHTWSHPHPDKVGLEAYLDDLRKGHEAVAEHLPDGAVVPFRYPYLGQSFDPETRDGIRAELEALGSPYTPVTIDTMDYLYAKGYTAALREEDGDRAERYRQSWWWNLQEATELAEWQSRELFGREPPQILLIHANELNAHHLGSYLDWAQERGYRFVTLDEALDDPAYAEPDPSLSPTGDSLWLRLRRSRTLEGGAATR